MKDKIYTQFDIDTAERITAVETKLDNIDKNMSQRFDGIEETLKSIHNKQNQEFKLKDGVAFIKKNYKWLTIILIVLIGGDAARQRALDFIFGSGHSEAQESSEENK